MGMSEIRVPEDLNKVIDSLGIAPEEMDLAYLAAKSFLQRHPDLRPDDPLYERSIHARVVICYHERIARVEAERDEARRENLRLKDVNAFWREHENLMEQTKVLREALGDIELRTRPDGDMADRAVNDVVRAARNSGERPK